MKYFTKSIPRILLAGLLILTVLLLFNTDNTSAVPLTSPNYRLDTNAINSFGGAGSSSNYKLVSTGGEAIVGDGQGGSYKLSQGYVSQLNQSLELTVQASGLKAYYPLDVGVGIQAYDATSNDNHGVLTNGPTWLTNGKISKAVTFDGSNDSIIVSNHSSIQVSTGTVSAWIKTASAGSGTRAIIAKNSAYGIFMVNNVLGIYDWGAGQWRMTTTALDDGNWHHVAFSFQSGVTNGTKVYIDGNSVLTTTYTINSQSNDLTIGSSLAAQYFTGHIDEPRVYSRVLSDDEIRNLYDANNAGIKSALTIPQVTPGASQNTAADVTVITDAPGYTLAINQNNNLTHTDTTTQISAISGSIGAPNLWVEGTTKGLGFTLTDAIDRSGLWGTSPNFAYAPIPNSATTFHTRSGMSGGVKEVSSLQFRLDVANTQKSGAYNNIVTITATLIP